MRYFAPKTLEQAIEILLENENSMILAGGTDLMVEKRSGKIDPDVVVDIKKLENELRYLKYMEGNFLIGPLVTVTDILHKNTIPHELLALKDAARVFGCHEIRNRATIGGNIAHASPGAEFASTLVSLDATFELTGKNNTRNVSAKDFFLGPGKANFERGEILTQIRIPVIKNSSSCYLRASRVDGMDLAIINTTVRLINKEKEQIDARIVFGAVAGKPVRIPQVERLVTEEKFDEAKKLLIETLKPRATSLRAAPLTKKILAGNLMEDAYLIAKERLNI